MARKMGELRKRETERKREMGKGERRMNELVIRLGGVWTSVVAYLGIIEKVNKKLKNLNGCKERHSTWT